MNVPDVSRNLVPDLWSANREGALPELGLCSRENSCNSCKGMELMASRLYMLNLTMLLKYARPH